MKNDLNTHWKAKLPQNLPDFIIGGAMKSGTTSLHTILNSHPDVSIAHDELGFFDIDNLLQHSDYNFFNKKNQSWTTQSLKENPELLWNWYYSQFEKLKKNDCIIGEDSTTYLASENAAKRIAIQNKPIKVIFILRHPTKRAISNYLHNLKSGRAIYNLEDTLRYNPNSILRRSLYKSQLETYYKHLPFNQIKVILFEDLINHKESCIQEVCEFLGVDFSLFNKDVFNTHSNKTKVPKSLRLQLLRNRLLISGNRYRYSNFMPTQPDFQQKNTLFFNLINKLHKKINLQRANHTFSPSKTTIKFLNDFFKMELEGIDDLVKKDIFSKWFNSEK